MICRELFIAEMGQNLMLGKVKSVLKYKPLTLTALSQYLNRKNSYSVFLIINIAMAFIRLGVFPGQTVLFHIVFFVASLSFFILGWEILLLIHHYFEGIFPIVSQPVKRMVIQTVLTTIVFTIFSMILFPAASRLFDQEITPMLSRVIVLLNFLIAIIYNLILFGTHYFYQWKSDLISKTNLEKEQAVVKYDALRNQLNPHFLFNALTSLNSLIFENQQLASDFLQQLSKVYRYILQNKDKETVSLRTELNFVQHYVFLLKTRFGESILIKIEANDGDMDRGIVPVLSQMLIENAIKHNVVSMEDPLIITITSNGDFLIVENNLIKKVQVESSNKVGLEHLKALYKYLSDKPVQIEETQNQFIVRTPLI